MAYSCWAALSATYRTLSRSLPKGRCAPCFSMMPNGSRQVPCARLTAAEFRDAIGRAQGTCLLPFGIMEKHGAHLPLGNDLLNVRYAALNAAQQEYAIGFPA